MTALDADLALITPLDGLHVGQLTLTELEALSRLVVAGLADREYSGAAGFLGLPKVRIIRPDDQSPRADSGSHP